MGANPISNTANTVSRGELQGLCPLGIESQGRGRDLQRPRRSWADISSALLLQSIICLFIKAVHQMCTGGLVCGSECSEGQSYGSQQEQVKASCVRSSEHCKEKKSQDKNREW